MAAQSSIGPNMSPGMNNPGMNMNNNGMNNMNNNGGMNINSGNQHGPEMGNQSPSGDRPLHNEMAGGESPSDFANLAHLPPKQRELFMRIQAHQRQNTPEDKPQQDQDQGKYSETYFKDHLPRKTN